MFLGMEEEGSKIGTDVLWVLAKGRDA